MKITAQQLIEIMPQSSVDITLNNLAEKYAVRGNTELEKKLILMLYSKKKEFTLTDK